MHYKLCKLRYLALLLSTLFFCSTQDMYGQCAGAFKVLHYTETSATDHNTRNESLSFFQTLGAGFNFTVVNDNTGDEFNTLASLQEYAVVIFSNTSGDAILSATQRGNFEDYIAGGGSYMGIHAAAETYRHSSATTSGVGVWDFFAEIVNGASAPESPNPVATLPTYVGTMDQVPIAQPYFIGIPDPWSSTGEYYYWENGYQNLAFLEILSLRATGPQSYEEVRMASHVSDLATGGRSFFTSLGHHATDFTSNIEFQNLLRNAVLWTAEPNIPGPGTGLTLTSAIIDASCGLDNGAVDITVSGGSGTYSYAWSNGALTEDVSGLAPGSYGVLAVDGLGCYALVVQTIGNIPGAVTVDIDTLREIDCNGALEGALQATAFGTNFPFSYTWDSGQTTASISGIGAGTYEVIVSNTLGCKDTATAILSEPPPISISLNETNNLECFGDTDGEITATVGGGTGGYNYSWDNGQTTAIATGLGAGKHVLTVTDANGCVQKDSLTLLAPLDISISLSETATLACFGDTDGEISATVGGGTAGYMYAWDNGQTTAIATGLAAGKHVLTVTDANGCVKKDSLTLVEPPALTLSLAETASIDCFEGTDGEISATVGGGTPGYTYAWSNGQSTPIASGLSAGKHVLTVTDANGCVKKDSLTIAEPPAINIGLSQTASIDCFGDTDGEITATVGGGTPGYNYSWSNGQTTAIATGLAAGKHVLTITDANGCVAKDSLTLTEPSDINISLAETGSIDCFAGTDGEITATVGGGTPGYTYAWSNGQTTPIAIGLSAGKHVLTVTDANACVKKDSLTLAEPTDISINLSETASIDCFGDTDGEISATVGGGTPGYNYSWSNGQTTAIATGLATGKHVLTVTDANGCIAKDSLTLTEPPAISIGLSQTATIDCFGDTDGEISATVGGGTGGYNYSWDNGQTTAIATGLAAGKHVLTVTDANGCIAKDSLTLTEPPAISIGLSQTATIDCFGDTDGEISATVGGGTGGYNYSWDNGQTTAIATGLAAGKHVLTVTDANGCVQKDSLTISEPPVIAISLSETGSIDCVGDTDGEISAAVVGGTPGYTYAWDNGQTGAIATGLAAGKHVLTVTDSNGCIQKDSLTISEPLAISISLSETAAISCFAGTDGEITATVGGGTPGYTYAWDNGQTGAIATGLAAGKHVLTITDVNGCIAKDSLTLTEPPAITISLSQTATIDCFGDTDGEITATVGGGTPGYTYAWSNGQTTAIATGLAAGKHVLTITDANGCVAKDSLTLTEPPAISISLSQTATIDCFGDTDGEITATVGGGTSGYDYSWSNGQTTAIASGLAAGKHILTVTDANGCVQKDSLTISEPPLIVINLSETGSIDCVGDTDGEISATVGGGTPGYTYAWDNGQTTPIATGLAAGKHVLTITDANGCVQKDSLTINEPPVISMGLSETAAIGCFGGADGEISAMVSGGTPGYTYAWSNGQTTAIATGLAAGKHVLTVTDANGCIAKDSLTLTEPLAISIGLSQTATIDCFGDTDGEISATVGGGTPGYNYSWSNGQMTAIATGLAAGKHVLTVTDANGCIQKDSLTISEPPVISINLLETNSIDCFGDTDGEISAIVGGGTPGYTYSWSNGQTTAIATGLSAGKHVLTVTDANGCIQKDSLTLAEPPVLSISLGETNTIDCFGDTDGEITATVNGGTPGYSYFWDNGQTSAIASGLGSGKYVLTVQDVNGCTAKDSLILTEPSEIVLTLTETQGVDCFGTMTGEISTTVIGGIGPYTYSWNNGQTTPIASNLAAGTHILTVTDANGCMKVDSLVLSAPSNLTLTTSILTQITCYDENDGVALGTATGGTPGYTYAWDNGQTTAAAINLSAGKHVLTVTDAASCIVKDSVTLVQPDSLIATTAIVTDISCFGANDGVVSGVGSGGTAPYTFLWNTGDTTAIINNLSPGTYILTLTDANGCVAMDSVTLIEPDVLQSTLAETQSIDCFGDADGEITASVLGGTMPYSYAWDSGQTTAIIDTLSPGKYVVTITDARGCTLKDSLEISQPDSLTVTANISSMISCFGANDGIVMATPSGGTGPYTYAWRNGQTTAQNANLGPGTYLIIVTDANGCTAVDSVSLTEPSALQLTLTQVQGISCFGAADGAIDGGVSGGTFPYTYVWDNGQNTPIASNLAAGQHILTVTDANGCVKVDSLEITEPNILIVSASVIRQVSCFGFADGSASVVVAGGTRAYSYLWSNGGTGAQINGVGPGTYVVNITDANGCTGQDSVIITEPPLLQIALSEALAISCNAASDGAVSVFASGGTPSYSYLWDDGQTGQTAINLSEGWHVVEVTDQNACTIKDSLFINDPDPLVGTITEVSPVLCYGSTTGALQVNTVGGNPPYDYIWNTGAPTAAINNLPAGQYSVAISDLKSCKDTAYFAITQPDSITISISQTQIVSCNGSDDGALLATVSGGTAPYTYLWSNGATSLAANNLTAGSYSLQVTDANGCTNTGLFTLTEPVPLSLTFSTIKEVSCNGGMDGEARVNVGGGTGPYSYAWSDGQTNALAQNLAAGTYKVFVTDANFCIDSAEVVILEPAILTASLSVSKIISCNEGNDGSILASPTGGRGTYTYLWSNGQTTQTATNLSIGTYTVTVTDSLGCTFTDSLAIDEPPLLEIFIDVESPIGCNGERNGVLNTRTRGGLGSYTYLWNTGWTGSRITGLGEGLYTITVTDSMGCTSSADTLFQEPNILETDIVLLDSIDCFRAKTAALIVNVNGGTPGYSYNWFDGSTTADRMGLGAGTYKLTVIDSRGCSKADSITIMSPPELVLTTSVLEDASCNGFLDGRAEVSAIGGSPPYSYLWTNGDTSAIADGLAAGKHYVTVTDDRNCAILDSVLISEPSLLSLDLSMEVPITCFGGIDGQLLARVGGGTAPYTYLWSNGQMDSLAMNLSADLYTVAVTDSQGCVISDSIRLEEPTLLEVSITQSQAANCEVADNGSASATVSGGIAPYTYLWSNGQTSSVLENVTPGLYVLSITDSLGCTLRDSIQIESRAPWIATVAIVDSVTCSGSEDGTAEVSIDPFGGSFTYLWSNGETQDHAVNLGPVTYNVQVRDEFGCDTTLTIEMNKPPQIQAFASITMATPGESNGSIQIDSIFNGTAPYNFLWSNGDTDSLASMLSQGTYFLDLIDAEGCEIRQEYQVDTTTFAWNNFEAIPDFNTYRIQLLWSSKREIGNSKYTIERSEDQLLFTPVIEQPSKGNSLNIQNYEDWDENPIEGRSFYRLKQTSENGYFTFYSPIQEVYFGNEDPGYVFVFPVPVVRGESIRVEFEMKEVKSTDILIRNAAHQEVYRSTISLPEGRQSMEISTAGLSPGHYYILVGNGSEAYTSQLIITDN